MRAPCEARANHGLKFPKQQCMRSLPSEKIWYNLKACDSFNGGRHLISKVA